MSQPWMPLYVADYLADTGHLGPTEHGAYFLLIMQYWQKGGLPDDDRQLARITRMTDRAWTKTRPVLVAFFEDGWRHERIDRELAKAAEISSRRKASADRRWSKPDANASANAEQLECKRDARGRENSQPQPQDRSSLREDSSTTPLAPLDTTAPDLPKPDRQRADDRELILDLVDQWNDLARSTGLAQVENISPKRIAGLRARIRDMRTCGFEDPREGFRRLVANIRASPFLLGQETNWRADFDFVLTPKGFTKTIEGSYAGKGKVVALGRH